MDWALGIDMYAFLFVRFCSAVPGFGCCVGAARGPSLFVARGGFSLAVVCGLLIAVASPVAEHRLQGVGASVVAAPGP